jgi:hypothetical protein
MKQSWLTAAAAKLKSDTREDREVGMIVHRIPIRQRPIRHGRPVKGMLMANTCVTCVCGMAQVFGWIWKKRRIISNSPLIKGMLMLNACMACICGLAEVLRWI